MVFIFLNCFLYPIQFIIYLFLAQPTFNSFKLIDYIKLVFQLHLKFEDYDHRSHEVSILTFDQQFFHN
jgi:hypothetical protein